MFAKLQHRSAASPRSAFSRRNLCSLSDSALDCSFSFVLPNFQLSTFNFQPPLFPKSLPLNSFADPHPITSIESYRYKNVGGRRVKPLRRSDIQTFQRASKPSPFLSPIYGLTYTTGGAYLLCFQPLAHSFYRDGGYPPTLPILELIPLPIRARLCPLFSSTSMGPTLQALYFHIHPCNGGCTPLGARSWQPTNGPVARLLSFTSHKSRVTSHPIRPIAAKRLWCNNSQRHEISSRSGETTPLPLVSKDRERTSGTVRQCSRSETPIRSGLQVVPGSIVLKLDRSRVARATHPCGTES